MASGFIDRGLEYLPVRRSLAVGLLLSTASVSFKFFSAASMQLRVFQPICAVHSSVNAKSNAFD